MTSIPPHDLPPRYRQVRRHSLVLAEGLSAEDQAVQAMADTSPTKWHLAHTTWFFETLVLQPNASGHRPVDERYGRLFNSYYESLGERHPRPQRGLLTRPSLTEVHAYREAVDLAMQRFLVSADATTLAAALPLIELGLQHEQQHQELLQTDALYLLAQNPLQPAWRDGVPPASPVVAPGWAEHGGGLVEVGHAGAGFAFDNETPRHRVALQPFALARRLVSNAEFQAFIDDGGYRQPALWLSDGWAAVLREGWQAPLYWRDGGGEFTLHGVQPRLPDAPVRHLSFYEAAAYAEWAGLRLPSEFEWEAAAAAPTPPAQCFGVVWQWTRSSYDPYPRFRPLAGAAGEYNGKFMVGQIVLRGSSAFSSAGHARATYRNFFPAAARWQLTGLRLAKDL